MLKDVNNVLEERIDPSVLDSFRDKYKKQMERGHPSYGAQFDFASALVRSTKADARLGVEILECLLKGDDPELVLRDCIYYLAVGHARLNDYDRALSYLETLLAEESTNRQVIALKELIDKKMRQDGLVGMAILGGGGAIIAGVVAALLFAAKK